MVNSKHFTYGGCDTKKGSEEPIWFHWKVLALLNNCKAYIANNEVIMRLSWPRRWSAFEIVVKESNEEIVGLFLTLRDC